MSALGDLASRGYTVAWLESRDPALRTTIHNCAAKLREHDLWRFVRAEADSDVGTMHFLATDVDALKRSLGPRFTRPAASDEEWESSERCFSASLHLKHFRGWPRDKVQAHVDRAGLWLPRRWWFVPPVPLVQMLRHWLHYESYRDVETIRRILEKRAARRAK